MRSLFILAILSMALFAPAATNVVASGESALILPAVITRPMDIYSPTGRVDTVGSFVKEGSVVRQRTSNGWEVCPGSRNLVIIQKLGTGGTAVVKDGAGELVRLTDALPAVVFTSRDTPTSPIWVDAVGAGVTVFYSQR